MSFYQNEKPQDQCHLMLNVSVTGRAGVTTNVNCSLCQAGTYGTGSGDCLSCPSQLDWIRGLIELFFSGFLVSCAEMQCFQEVLPQAPAASVSLEDTLRAQVARGLGAVKGLFVGFVECDWPRS